MAQTYFYSSDARITSLAADIDNSTTSITVGATTGFPGNTPYTLIIDQGLSTQEVVSVTGVSGTTLTVVRGFDGSDAQAHTTGALVAHGVSAKEFNDANAHQNSGSEVHGVSGNLNSAIQDKLSKANGGTVNAATTFALPSGAGGTVGVTIAGIKITITDPNDVFTQAFRIDVPADPSSTTRTAANGAKGTGAGAPDTWSVYFNGSPTGGGNEFGELRARAAKVNTVAFRVLAKSGGSTSQVLQDWYGPSSTSVANMTGGGDLTVNSITTTSGAASVAGNVSSGSNITATGNVTATSGHLYDGTKQAATIVENVNTQTPTANYTIPDVTTATMHVITLTANRTLTLPTPAVGKSFSVLLVQGGAGSFTVTWATPSGAIKWSNGSAPTLTTTATKADEVVFRCYDGTNWVGSLAANNI